MLDSFGVPGSIITVSSCSEKCLIKLINIKRIINLMLMILSFY